MVLRKKHTRKSDEEVWYSQGAGYSPVTPAFWRLRQQDHKCKPSLSNLVTQIGKPVGMRRRLAGSRRPEHRYAGIWRKSTLDAQRESGSQDSRANENPCCTAGCSGCRGRYLVAEPPFPHL